MDEITRESVRVAKFDGGREEDFELWRMRLEATLEGRELSDVVMGDEKGIIYVPEDRTSDAYLEYARKVRKAKSILVNALGDKPLRTIQGCSTPAEMWWKLKDRYASTSITNQIQVMTTLMNLKYLVGKDMGDHISEMESYVSRLAQMSLELSEAMQVAILLVSLQGIPEFAGTVAALKTMDLGVECWTKVTTRLIEEQKEIPGKIIPKKEDTSGVFTTRTSEFKNRRRDLTCWTCGKKGHFARECRSSGGTPGRKNGSDNGKTVRFATLRKPVGADVRVCTATALDSDIVVDSGASEHVVHDIRLFENLEETTQITVETADGTKATTKWAGDVRVRLSDGIQVVLTGVYYVPQLSMNLMSCGQLDEKEITASFENARCIFRDRRIPGTSMGYAGKRKQDGLYIATCMVPDTKVIPVGAAKRGEKATSRIWHMRMGHAGQRVVQDMCEDTEYGMAVADEDPKDTCVTCVEATQTKSTMTGKLATDEQDITVHSDICGPFGTRTRGGKRYFATFIVSKSRYCDVALLKTRDEVREHLYEFIAWVERNTGRTVKRIHTDGAKEYKAMEKPLKTRGIRSTYSSAYTPQSNGLAERMNRTLLNKTRSMLKCAGMSDGWWGEALLHATHLYNRTVTKVLKQRTPFEALLDAKPVNSNLRVFGCEVYVHVHKEQGRGKLGDRGKRGVLLSHSDGVYRVYMLATKTVISTKHVVFNEHIFPLIRKNDGHGDVDVLLEEESEDISEEPGLRVEHPEEQETEEEISIQEESQEESRRYPTRERNQPDRFIAGSARRTRTEDEPTAREALASEDADQWKTSMDSEVQALKKLDCWTVVENPGNANVMHSKFVLKKKRKSDGTVAKYKARLVVCGNEDVDYIDDSFAPVVDFTLVKLFLAIAVQRKWQVRQLDFDNAFPNGKLDRDVYVYVPRHGHVENIHGAKVLKLNRSLYGLREAGKVWYELLVKELKAAGLHEMKHAPCVFLGEQVVVLIYVDDILVMGASLGEIEKIVTALSSRLKTKDLGRASHFLGVDLIWTKDNSLRLRQTKLIRALLEDTKMWNCKPMSTPASMADDLSLRTGNRVDTRLNYRSVVGSILYLAVKTRPDLAVTISQLARHVEDPGLAQEQGVKRVLKYLRGSMNSSLMIEPGDSDQLVAHVDSSWGGEAGFGRKSRTGIVIKYGNAPVYTTSVLQKCTALSSTEAEFIALSEGSRIITWLRRVLEEFKVKQDPTVIYQDNSGSIAWATGNNAKQFAKRKHVDIRYHFVVEKIQENTVELRKISTLEMEADFLTKVLAPAEFKNAIEKYNIIDDTAGFTREEEC